MACHLANQRAALGDVIGAERIEPAGTLAVEEWGAPTECGGTGAPRRLRGEDGNEQRARGLTGAPGGRVDGGAGWVRGRAS